MPRAARLVQLLALLTSRPPQGNPNRRTYNGSSFSEQAISFVCLDYYISHAGDPAWDQRQDFFEVRPLPRDRKMGALSIRPSLVIFTLSLYQDLSLMWTSFAAQLPGRHARPNQFPGERGLFRARLLQNPLLTCLLPFAAML